MPNPYPGSGQNQRQNSQSRAPQLSKLVFFKDGAMPPDLLSKQAEDWAKKIGTNMTSSQLRKFYGDVKTLERKVLTSTEDQFKQHIALVGMLKAKVAYASNPKKAKIPRDFKDFIDQSVDAIENDRTKFLNFCKFFEAVVGYLYGLGIADK